MLRLISWSTLAGSPLSPDLGHFRVAKNQITYREMLVDYRPPLGIFDSNN